MIKSILYALLGAAGIGEFWVIWCVAAAVENNAPFPRAAAIIGGLLVSGYCIAGLICLGVSLYRRFFRRRESRRLGIIRFDRYGNLYYAKK